MHEKDVIAAAQSLVKYMDEWSMIRVLRDEGLNDFADQLSQLVAAVKEKKR